MGFGAQAINQDTESDCHEIRCLQQKITLIQVGVEISYKSMNTDTEIDGQVGDVIISKAMQSRDQTTSQPRYELQTESCLRSKEYNSTARTLKGSKGFATTKVRVRAESCPRSRDTIQQSENKRIFSSKQRALKNKKLTRSGSLGPVPRLDSVISVIYCFLFWWPKGQGDLIRVSKSVITVP